MAMDGEENEHSIGNIYKEQREKKTQHKNLRNSINYVYIHEAARFSLFKWERLQYAAAACVTK